MKCDTSQKTSTRYILIGLMLGVALTTPLLGSNFFDDAYIHARLARNISNYGQPIFNPGDQIKIGSSTGFIYIISALSYFLDHITAIKAVEFIAIVATTTGFFFLVSLQQKPNRFYAILSFTCIFPYFLHAAYGGMETPLLCMLLIFSATAFHLNKYLLAISLISLSTWIRFEAILLLGLACCYFITSKRITPRQLALPLIPFIALIAAELWLYGSIIPHAAKAKQASYGFSLPASISNAIHLGHGRSYRIIGIAVILFSFLHLHRLALKRFRLDWSDVFALFAIGVFSAWAFGRSLIFPWYHCLLALPFGLLLITGNQPEHPNKTAGRLHRGLHVASCVGFAILGINILLTTYGFNPRDHSSKRVTRYIEIGSALHKNCPSCTLVTSEIGGLGFSFPGAVYDAFGLADPVATRFHPMRVPDERQDHGIGAIPVEYAELRNSDYIVSMPIFSEALRRSDFINRYVRYECPIGRHNEVLIFGDTTIEIYSKITIPHHVVNGLRCVKQESKSDMAGTG